MIISKPPTDKPSLSILGPHVYPLKPSKGLGGLLLLIQCFVLFMFLYAYCADWLPLWVLVLLEGGCLWSGIYFFRLHVFYSHPQSIIAIVWDERKKQWVLPLASGDKLEATLCRNSVLSSHFALVNFKSKIGKTKRSVILCSDSIEQDHFRQLRVRLGLMPREMCC